jgi:hypothetical protein
MLEETLGKNERRATTIVLAVLFIEALWVFLHRYFPLDAALWALQSDLVREHAFGVGRFPADPYRLIAIPAPGIAFPLFSGLLNTIFSGEVATRFLVTFVGILLRGCAYLALFRTLRVRDEAVYCLIPVFTFSSIWFSGAIPYLAGETIAVATIAYLLAQDRPRSSAYWILATGFGITALTHALAFLVCCVVVFFVTQEQRRSVHLSQGWLSKPRAVLGLLIPGAVILLLNIFIGGPIFKISTSGLLPAGGTQFIAFICTPVPCVLEAMLRGTNIFQLVISASVTLLVIGCLVRAILLAMEEPTWQSRTLKSAGVVLLLLTIAGIWLHPIGIDTPATIGAATLLLLAGSYSRGPAIRRTIADRILLTGAIAAMIICGLFNGFSVNQGSAAAGDVLKRARALVSEEKSSAREDEHVDSIRITFVMDSSLIADESSSIIATFSYSVAAPTYLFSRSDVLKNPSVFQPLCGAFRLSGTPSDAFVRSAPIDQIKLPSPLDYVSPHVRLLAVLPSGTSTSKSFGPFDFALKDPLGGPFTWGAAQYGLLIGKLSAHANQSLAAR